MSFRRTAIGLITVVSFTAILAGVYLYFNFNSRSNLISVVPQNANWFYHFQTKKIKSKMQGPQPAYFDSFTKCFRNLPIFTGIKEPTEPGIALFSDLVLFSNQYGWYAAISVNSESKLTAFVKSPGCQMHVGGIIPSADCKFVKAKKHAIYFAWKHKACVVFVPNDTLENLDRTEQALAVVFKEEKKSIITELKGIKELYDKDGDILFYAKEDFTELTQTVNLRSTNAEFYFPKGKAGKKISPLWLFSKAGAKFDSGQLEMSLNKDNTLTSQEYLNLTFKTFFQYLKPYTE